MALVDASDLLQVWHLSDMDSNQLLSKPEFCLFMYLMHALRNFGTGFRLPEHITPPQAAKILGLEGLVRSGASGGSGGAPPAGPSSQGYNPAQAHSGNGSLQGPQQHPQQGQQYPQQHPQQGAQQDWEATGGLSPSQQQAVQELTALGFESRHSQVCPSPSHTLLSNRLNACIALRRRAKLTFTKIMTPA